MVNILKKEIDMQAKIKYKIGLKMCVGNIKLGGENESTAKQKKWERGIHQLKYDSKLKRNTEKNKGLCNNRKRQRCKSKGEISNYRNLCHKTLRCNQKEQRKKIREAQQNNQPMEKDGVRGLGTGSETRH